MSNPKLLDMPLAQNADKNDIPVTDSGSTGLFSQQYGWQLINAIPPQNGGKAVKREDFNGVFNLIGDLLYHIQKGYTFEYDSRQSYWKGCKVRDPATGLTYQALNDIPANSTNSPHEDATNWVICPAEQGYIIPSTAYAVGATANHYALPPSYYLECTTPGTTGATAPVITSVIAGDTITDGSVVWTVRQCLPTSGGVLDGNLFRSNTAGATVIGGGTNTQNGGYITICGKDVLDGEIAITGCDESNSIQLDLVPRTQRLSLRLNSRIDYDLGGSAIVAKSLGENGYIKLASGEIRQWGQRTISIAGDYPLTLPISYSNASSWRITATAKRASAYNTNINVQIIDGTKTANSITLNTSEGSGYSIEWVAIGY